jgi:hypothetical protein
MKEVARFYENSVTFVSNTTREYDDSFIIDGAHVGNTVSVRLPQRFQMTTGQALQQQNLLDSIVPITLTTQGNVAFGYSSAQATTELDDIRGRYVQPAALALASGMDATCFQAVYRDATNFVGTLGTTANSILTYGQAGVKLSDMSCPLTERKAVLDPLAMVTIAQSTTTLFNPQGDISANYRTGMFGRNVMGIQEWYQDQNRPTHTTGSTGSSTPIVNNASQTGSSITTTGWTSLAAKKGDKVTFASVFSVNKLGYVSTGRLQQFTLTADVTDSGGAATLSISPSIITSGALQTVSASPGASAIVLLWNQSAATYTQSATVSPISMVFHKSAFAVVTADLIDPGPSAQCTFVRDKSLGLSMRWVQQYQIGTDQKPSRIDILFGAATIFPDRACEVVG